MYSIFYSHACTSKEEMCVIPRVILLVSISGWLELRTSPNSPQILSTIRKTLLAYTEYISLPFPGHSVILILLSLHKFNSKAMRAYQGKGQPAEEDRNLTACCILLILSITATTAVLF